MFLAPGPGTGPGVTSCDSPGERAPARETTIDALQVKEIRKLTGLSQAKFAQLVDVRLGTLRNWEQGRREPTGPAKALMRVIRHDPQAVVKALKAG